MTINLAGRAPALQWLILVALSFLFFLGLQALHIPAALLLGPMAAAIVVASAEGTVRVPVRPFVLAQGAIGCLIAGSIAPSTLTEMARDWPIFLAVIASVIVVSNTLGWFLARWQVLPGTTAVWGSSPGAAAAMTLMAEAYGADIRLVAFMQYLRVVFVAVVASLVSRIWASGPLHTAEFQWFPPLDWLGLAQTLLLIGLGSWLSVRLRVPAGPMLVPMIAGIVLHNAGLMTIVLPPWLLALSYALIGWNIGSRFTRQILVHAARALPRVVASIMILISLCGGIAAILVFVADVDPLTAYLATSPGGADSIAIIAASSNVDLPFVMAMQTARFLIVLITGPAIARFIAKHTGLSNIQRPD
ncbi:AbrB family transcriptional regulator [Phyllobacterium sp. 21LDTY02-6]|uniref:AbrB family transcriptional regulator n=1 Tax=Phyllobacterium sp. 21LDTY02-6 TaxID=2944903 RepID=UPI002020F036|nr:AbrB family transcriptional regulator [Phyllobacterium sp. 21LDTY02-6]MCO4318711.1 AbrB family transcriptional regulator [Phyllobacterium sp. 21LDTY02-6]